MTTVSPEVKSLALTLKDASNRTFEAIVSTASVDRDGDIVLPSAFKSGQRVPLIVGHSWDRMPVGSGVISTTPTDARMAGAFFDTDAGREAYSTAKQLAELTEFSIGFIAKDVDYERRGEQTVRVIKQLELLEVSIVLKGAAFGTGLVDIKGRRREWDDLDRWAADLSADLDDELSAKSLSRRGFDVVGDSGWLSYKGVDLWPREVVEKPEEMESTDIKTLRREARTVLSPLYTKGFFSWLSHARNRGGVNALYMVEADARKALSEGLDEGGGFLAPPELLAGVTSYRAQLAVMRGLSRVVPTGRDVAQIPMFGPHSSSEDTFSSNFAGAGAWVGEVPTWSYNDPDFQLFAIAIKKLLAPLLVSNDLLDDTEGLIDAIARDGGENLALLEDQAFIAGPTGAAPTLEPVGFLNAGLTATDVAGTTSNTISNTVSDAGSAPKLITLQGSLASQYRRGAAWIMRSTTETNVRQLVDVAGRYVWPREDGTFMGDAIAFSDFIDADGSSGNQPIAYVGRGSYVIADRLSLAVRVLSERFADTDQTGILLKERVGGGLLRRNGIVIGSV